MQTLYFGSLSQLNLLPMRIKICFTALSLALFASAQENSIYQLVWEDNFDEDGKPSEENWTYENGFVRNQEDQWYQPDNAFCENGYLIIEAKEESRPNPRYQKSSENWRESRKTIQYTSASLKTMGKQSWQFGRFEIRAKITTEEGLWPAIWFLGVEGQWPSCGEIDLMEYYDHSILANAAWGTEKKFQAKWDSEKIEMQHFGAPDWDDSFHLWRMDWDEHFIRLYLDNELLNQIDLKETMNPTSDGPRNPFHQPHYLLLNLAIGGTQGGDPTKATYPSRYIIDYVRVWQKQ